MNKKLLIKYIYAVVITLFLNPMLSIIGLFTSSPQVLSLTIAFTIIYSVITLILIPYLFHDVVSNFKDSLIYTAPIFLVSLFSVTFQGTYLGITAAYNNINAIMRGMLEINSFNFNTIMQNLQLALASLYTMPLSVALWFLMAYITDTWAKLYLKKKKIQLHTHHE